jgi:hypothetical protein
MPVAAATSGNESRLKALKNKDKNTEVSHAFFADSFSLLRRVGYLNGEVNLKSTLTISYITFFNEIIQPKL